MTSAQAEKRALVLFGAKGFAQVLGVTKCVGERMGTNQFQVYGVGRKWKRAFATAKKSRVGRHVRRTRGDLKGSE